MNREDLAGNNPLLIDDDLHRPLYWRVYEDYEILPSKDKDVPYVQAAPRKGSRKPVCVKVYRPLTDTPHLFLEFARIWERKDRGKALMDWISQYGLLGFTQLNPQYGREWLTDSYIPRLRYDDRGGPEDDVDLILGEARQANEALTLYEAAMSRDVDKLKEGLFWDEESGFNEDLWQRSQEKAQSTGADLTDILVERALVQILEYTLYPVRTFAYPDIALPTHSAGLDDRAAPQLGTDQLTASWGARNLVGVIYLQFYWLITSQRDLSRCKYCGRIISYAPPMPGMGERKPRRDKEFCSTQCRQNYHYHNRVKPRHQSEAL
jgi:hypothetical protein